MKRLTQRYLILYSKYEDGFYIHPRGITLLISELAMQFLSFAIVVYMFSFIMCFMFPNVNTTTYFGILMCVATVFIFKIQVSHTPSDDFICL